MMFNKIHAVITKVLLVFPFSLARRCPFMQLTTDVLKVFMLKNKSKQKQTQKKKTIQSINLCCVHVLYHKLKYTGNVILKGI